VLNRLVIFSVIFATVSAACVTPFRDAAAQRRGGISLIRDAETEDTIRAFAAPVFDAAGLDPAAVQVHLINDPQLNAFVAGGQRIFINTGLLLRVRNPSELIGVIAHETGHIAGGHLARLQDELRSATAQSIIAMLLGAAAIAGGAGNAGMAAIMGGQQIATRNLLRYSRNQESSADQAGATFLDRTGQTGRGLVSFLEILGDQEALQAVRQDPYVQTHPVNAERVAALRSRVEQSRFRDTPDRPEFVERLKLVQAKLAGFLEPPQSTLRKFPPTDTSVPARYARAVAWYRIPDLAKAVPEIDSLIAERPDNPYFQELKAQMLFENGRVAEAIPASEAAVRLRPADALLRLALGQAQVAMDDPALLKPAIANLEEAVRRDPGLNTAWLQLAMAYGRDGNRGMAAYASAERFMLEGNRRDARGQANVAVRLLPAGSPGWIRAQDILVASEPKGDERE
jgi:predicted Zn-dependent protease